MNWNKEGKELGFTFFVVGIIGFIVLGCFYLMNDLISGIIGAVIIFTVPLIFACIMIKLYDKHEDMILALQKNQEVMRD